MEKCCVSTHSLGSLIHLMSCGRKPCLLKHVRNFVSGPSLVFRVVEIFKLRWLLALNQQKTTYGVERGLYTDFIEAL